MSKGKTVYITKELIEDFETEELDFNLETEFGVDEYFDILVELEPKYGSAEGDAIKIDTMIKALENLKNKGATHVEMSYHCDHRSYEISAFNIRLSTQDEIDAHVAKITKQSDKQKQIAELEEQIKQIRKL